MELKVGAGKRKIEIPEAYLAVENFKTVHDGLHARAVVIEQGEKALLVSLELTSLPEQEVAQLRRMLSDKWNIKETFIWICMTHSFSSPHLFPEEALKSEEEAAHRSAYREAIQEAVFEAASEAEKSKKSARFGLETGFCGIVANRDVELEDGWWVGTGGMGLTDRTVTVLKFEDGEGNPIALLPHFGMQSSVLDQSELSGGGKAVTSDVAGMACQAVEKHFGNGAVAMFLLGAAGDQSPVEKAVKERFENGRRIRRDLHEEGFAVCGRLAGELARTVCALAEKTICDRVVPSVKAGRMKFEVPAKSMNRDLRALAPTRSYEYVAEGMTETEIEALCLGDVALLGVRPELNCRSAVAVTAFSAFRHTLVCTMVNGASKYMADRNSYASFRYEAMNSPFGEGAAELLCEKSIELLKTMKKEVDENGD